jgi:hypothetical protein
MTFVLLVTLRGDSNGTNKVRNFGESDDCGIVMRSCRAWGKGVKVRGMR